MYKRIFLDANIWLDHLDANRPYHSVSKMSIEYCLEHDIELFTSCDIIMTIYYINNRFNKKSALKNIEKINQLCKVTDFSNQEVTITCGLMQKDLEYLDLEDTIQYILAQKEQCDLILTNDKRFVSKDIDKMTTEMFSQKLGLIV